MSSQITRRLKPEEEELLRKREELAAIRATLAGWCAPHSLRL
jgi:hypothetical protein